jgi:UAA transporter family.
MVMGVLILKKRYTFSKYLSVLMITLGICICTIVSGKDVVSCRKCQRMEITLEVYSWTSESNAASGALQLHHLQGYFV